MLSFVEKILIENTFNVYVFFPTFNMCVCLLLIIQNQNIIDRHDKNIFM